MDSQDVVILVVSDAKERAVGVQKMIEFVDYQDVCSGTPSDWYTEVEDREIEAVFVDAELPYQDVKRFLDDLSDHQPDVPVVIVCEPGHA